MDYKKVLRYRVKRFNPASDTAKIKVLAAIEVMDIKDDKQFKHVFDRVHPVLRHLTKEEAIEKALK